LLRQRVVDAWLIAPPDHPEEDDPDLAVVPLATMPVRLVVGKSHPLADERGVTFRDVHRFPTLALPAGLLPKTEKRLQELGLWNSPVRMQFYDHDSWQGQCHDQATINYGSGLSLAQQPHLTTLDLPLNFHSGDALVVHRDLVSSPRIELLVRHLRGCLQRLIQHQHGFRLAAI
jgi:DNA-binding transcriptional LysR family regulator